MRDWRASSRVARHWRQVNGAAPSIVCGLCPRQCEVGDGSFGFCRVRGSTGGEFHTFNYGKSVAVTEEVIETEAIYHFSPGARTLSLGSVGCMMSCDFCQNWDTSQVKHLDTEIVCEYSPEEIIEICRSNDIGIISFTYNDPVVWHEYVLDVSREASRNGIRTLYKSALYLQQEPAGELLENIDIFSISLKSMDDGFYRRFAGGSLAPVLDRIKEIHASGRHLEISQLIIPGRNDRAEDVRRTVGWILDYLGCEVPLHFVGFHPAYRYTSVGRTSRESLLLAREIALGAGVRYCYLGNLFETGINDTICACGNKLVRRYGLEALTIGITETGARCADCGTRTPIKHPIVTDTGMSVDRGLLTRMKSTFLAWTQDAQAAHLRLRGLRGPASIHVLHDVSGRAETHRLESRLARVIVARKTEADTGVKIYWDGPGELQILPVLDRAHYPTGGDEEHE